MNAGPARLAPLGLALIAGCADHSVSFPCDVTTRDCQKAVFHATAETRGQPDAKLPPVRVITRKQLAAELRASVEQSARDLDDEAARQREQGQRGLSLFGLLPAPTEQSADDAYIEQSVASVAAYYSDESKDITIIADQTMDRDEAMITLSHEFVHALQDQREDLTELREAYVRTSDDDVALTSLIEGEADWLAYATYFDRVKGVGIERINYSKLFGSILRGTLAAIEDSSAPLIDMSELMPYPVGGRYVAQLDLAEGLESVAALYRRPPLALRSWVEDPPENLPGELDCDVAPAPVGYHQIDSDRLGFGGLMAFRIALGEDGMSAYNAAQTWRADKIATYAADDDPEAVAITWRIQLDSPLMSTHFSLLASDAPGVQVQLQGRAVVLSAATVPAVLSTWQPGMGCPALDKRRGSEPSGLLTRLKRGLGITR